MDSVGFCSPLDFTGLSFGDRIQPVVLMGLPNVDFTFLSLGMLNSPPRPVGFISPILGVFISEIVR